VEQLVVDGVRTVGEVRIYVIDGDLPSGQDIAAYIDSRDPDQVYRNMVTDLGRAQMTKRIVGEAADPLGYIGLSTSATTASLGALTLTDEIARKAVSVMSSIATYYQRYVAYFSTTDFNSTGIAGAGGFDTSSTGGLMWTIAAIALSKTAGQAAIVEWRVLASS
jgi:hypothetical protein